jgi:hypothetical protein
MAANDQRCMQSGCKLCLASRWQTVFSLILLHVNHDLRMFSMVRKHAVTAPDR